MHTFKIVNNTATIDRPKKIEVYLRQCIVRKIYRLFYMFITSSSAVGPCPLRFRYMLIPHPLPRHLPRPLPCPLLRPLSFRYMLILRPLPRPLPRPLTRHLARPLPCPLLSPLPRPLLIIIFCLLNEENVSYPRSLNHITIYRDMTCDKNN